MALRSVFFYGPYSAIHAKEIEKTLGAPPIWELTPPTNTTILQLPIIQYGIIPQGFVQVTPDNNSPPPLMEGKCYTAIVPTNGANEGNIDFCLRDGKVYVVPPP